MADFKENYIVPRFLERVPTFARGSNFSRGGDNFLLHKDTYITCDLPGGIRTPTLPPLGLRMYAGEI